MAEKDYCNKNKINDSKNYMRVTWQTLNEILIIIKDIK